MGNSSRRNILVVPQAGMALDQLKVEIAQELGIAVPEDGYWGNHSARDCGAIGGHITRRLVQIAEQTIAGEQTV
jgi:hypothetical protein